MRRIIYEDADYEIALYLGEFLDHASVSAYTKNGPPFFYKQYLWPRQVSKKWLKKQIKRAFTAVQKYRNKVRECNRLTDDLLNEVQEEIALGDDIQAAMNEIDRLVSA